jgi:predicted secreted protein
LNILGFSADGNVFAFEEYGVQDGSGFPYANRFYIDTTADEFLPGTPIRIRLDNEAASVAAARAEAETKGQAVLADRILTANPGYLAAFNAVTEESADPYAILANPRPIFPPIDKPIAFRLEETTAPVSSQCTDIGETKGFRLIMMHPAGASRTLHDDRSIPASRGCPQGYRLAACKPSILNPGNRPSPSSSRFAVSASRGRIIAGWLSRAGCERPPAADTQPAYHLGRARFGRIMLNAALWAAVMAISAWHGM